MVTDEHIENVCKIQNYRRDIDIGELCGPCAASTDCRSCLVSFSQSVRSWVNNRQTASEKKMGELNKGGAGARGSSQRLSWITGRHWKLETQTFLQNWTNTSVIQGAFKPNSPLPRPDSSMTVLLCCALHLVCLVCTQSTDPNLIKKWYAVEQVLYSQSQQPRSGPLTSSKEDWGFSVGQTMTQLFYRDVGTWYFYDVID